jgi:alpha-galactosidase
VAIGGWQEYTRHIMMVSMKWKFLLLAASLCASGTVLLSWMPRLNYTNDIMNSTSSDNPRQTPTAVAIRFTEKTDSDGLPPKSAWEKAPAFPFDQDWMGQNADPQRATEVRLLWTPETLFLRFHCNYRMIYVFSDARADGYRYELWDRDVAETFLQPDSTDPMVYREFEVSPNAYWIDLAVSHGKIEELHSGLKRRVVMDEKAKTWTAELAIPMKSLTTQFDPNHSWRANFYRIEGDTEPRFYSAWSPTYTPKPSFHVPSAFGTLEFRDQK